MMKANKLLLAVVLAGVGVASIATLAEDKRAMHKMMPAKEPAKAQLEGELFSLTSASGWLNSQPLTAADLRGKVVLVDVWTYTCINWLRQLPYVRAWAEKYKDQGLVVSACTLTSFRPRGKSITFAAPQATSACRIRSRSTTTLRYGALFGTSTGRLSILSMRRAVSGISTSAKDSTSSRKGSFKNCSPKPEPEVSVLSWFPSMASAPKLPPIGRA